MNKLKVELENCYGIKKLNYEFDFSNCNTYVIYAPNGVMKTSFAKTFNDFSKNVASKDEIYRELITIRNIEVKEEMAYTVPNNKSIFVINSYDEYFESDKVSTLIVNNTLREQYDLIIFNINTHKEAFLEDIKKDLEFKLDLESTLIKIFNKNNFIEVIKIINDILSKSIDYDFSEVDYNIIFNNKAEEFIKSDDFRMYVKEYIELYDSLLNKSRFFKNGFNHYKAKNISDELKKELFFEADHKLELFNSNNNDFIKVNSLDDFKKLIEEEKTNILTDLNLQDIFKKIDSKIKNKELELLREYLKNNVNLLVELMDFNNFKKKYWISHVIKKRASFDKLFVNFISSESELKNIFLESEKEQKLWVEVISEFNDRFFVPFKICIGNQIESTLNKERPYFNYLFNDGINEEQPVTKDILKNVLSSGEKKALYLLNIIFEIKCRQKEKINTIFIIDDIADSFDYKNKYAIIEYLKELSEEFYFKLIILTHNFEFYRTISSRFKLPREDHLHVIKNSDQIKLIPEFYQNDPIKTWKNNLKSNKDFTVVDVKKHIISLIPLVRNLIEFGNDKKKCNYNNIKNDYLFLTNILHIKSDTKNITVDFLKNIFIEYLGRNDFDKSINGNDKVYDLIMNLANNITNQDIKLENKIILAIAIRLKAEEYMLKKIKNKLFLKDMDGKINQTGYLLDQYISENENDNTIKILKRVSIMTPENIHLNSFMYEPIIDLNCDALLKLYKDVSVLMEE